MCTNITWLVWHHRGCSNGNQAQIELQDAYNREVDGQAPLQKGACASLRSPRRPDGVVPEWPAVRLENSIPRFYAAVLTSACLLAYVKLPKSSALTDAKTRAVTRPRLPANLAAWAKLRRKRPAGSYWGAI